MSNLKKYDFDITVNGGTYAGELALPYVTAALLGAETIAKGRCRLIEGVQYKAVINSLATTDTIQAANCAFNDGADLSLNEQVVELSDLAVMEVICRGTLFPTWVAAQGSMNRDGDLPVAFTDFLMASVADRTGTNLERLIWTGAAPFGVGLLSDDGTIDDGGIDASAMKDFAEADTGALGAWSKANILGVLDLIFDAAQATPGILQKPGCGFYVSYEAYAFFLQAIAGQSTNQGYNQELGGATYLGYPVYPTGGIPNTSDVAVFTYPDNIVVGTNNYTPDISAQLIPAYAYDGSDNVKVAMRFGVGVNVAVPGDGVVGHDFS